MDFSKEIYQAKKSGITVRIKIIGDNEYIGVIESTPPNHVTLAQVGSGKVTLWVDSIIEFEALEKINND
ncbi:MULTISPECIES: hypothetical protein [Cysteiniphilum]|uniref:hypothetical protein n=1 Tax=Cysteiniphilum TaxID=2056696 RepID=UPI00178224D1|nr:MULTISPECIES: hypothetical protein [Cysteiniphilum]